MKKVLFAIAIVMMMGFCANAQRDGFFREWDDVGNNLDRPSDITPGLPGSHGLTENQGAPVGSGLLILTALGAGYALRKRNA